MDQWLALDEDDGEVERLVPVAGKENVLGFKNLLLDNARMAITEEHLWISFLIRPSRSTFTRLQRLTCILSLLFMAMIADALFYGQEGTEERPKAVKVN